MVVARALKLIVILQLFGHHLTYKDLGDVRVDRVDLILWIH
ncbi:unannotated protein [freshwater metagenome]|uniref:Unannotated protein n=1 Tax=freshwater metagenome TaxID=449393 RepID=A0A6J6HJT1_9ZZZZ